VGIAITYDEVLEMLGYAAGNELTVRIITSDGSEVIGVPTTVDPDETAHEVFLRPADAEDTEIAVALEGIASVEVV
jgi:hypothetical protein